MFPQSSSFKAAASPWEAKPALGEAATLLVSPQPNRSQLSLKKHRQNGLGGVLSFGQLTVWLLVYEQTPAIQAGSFGRNLQTLKASVSVHFKAEFHL